MAHHVDRVGAPFRHPLSSFRMAEISPIIAPATSSEHFDQASTTLVVLLALGDEAVHVLLLELLNLVAGGAHGVGF